MRAVIVFVLSLAAVILGFVSAADSNRHTPAKRSFNAWGGKRGNADSWLMADVDSTNDGDVDDTYDEQKRAFSSWGGKRATANWAAVLDGGPQDGASKKRSKHSFYSWGGKRGGGSRRGPPGTNGIDGDGLELDDLLQEKRGGVRFSSWGGKRGASTDDGTNPKRAFSSWGGKRYDDDETLAAAGNSDDKGDEKRSFSSWGGKRADETERVRRSPDAWQGNPLSFLLESWLPISGESAANRIYSGDPPHLQTRRGSGPPFFSWGG